MNRLPYAALFVAGVFASIVAGPLLDHSTTSVTADGHGSHTVTTTIAGTTTQSGIADRSGHVTFAPVDGPTQTVSGQVDGTTGTGTGHFVNTVFGGVCNGQCSTP